MKKKSILMLFLLLSTVSVSTISAYFADGDTTTNTLVIGGNNISISEEFFPEPIEPNTVITKKVCITNDGPNDCYVRVRAVFTDSDVGQYATIDWNTSDWSYSISDGYYYYEKAVSEKQSTSYLMTSITFSKDMPENMIKDVDLIVYAESYQSDGFDSYIDAWNEYKKNIR